jgi:hypothetical protein
MQQLLRNVLDQHRAAGGHALLLSATLGGVSFACALKTPYPHCAVSRGQLPTIDAEPRAQKQKCVAVDLLEAAGVNDLAAQALAAARQGGRVLMIRNRVGDAQESQRALQAQVAGSGELGLLFTCEGVPAPHHARFAAEDRHLLDAALEGQFGKHAEWSGGVAASVSQHAGMHWEIETGSFTRPYNHLAKAGDVVPTAGLVGVGSRAGNSLRSRGTTTPGPQGLSLGSIALTAARFWHLSRRLRRRDIDELVKD